MSANDKFCDLEEAGLRLYLSPERVRQWCIEGKLPGALQRLDDRAWLVPTSSIDDWIKKHPLSRARIAQWLPGVRALNRFIGIPRITVWEVLGLVVTLIGFASALHQFGIFQRLGQMTGDFKIAVARFEVVGPHAEDEVGQVVASKVHLGLENAFDEFDFALTEEIWGPEQVGTVSGADAQSRAAAAEALAQRINANVVVYGLIDASQPTWNVVPEFFVRNVSAVDATEIQGVFTDQAPLTGQYEFGDGIQIPKGQLDDQQIAAGRKISERAELLARLLKGIAYYATRNYEWAYSEFNSIEEADEWPLDFGGIHLLYLLLGNSSGRSAILHEEYQLDLTEAYYDRALAERVDYDRALAGLANVYLVRALAPAMAAEDFRKADLDLLDQAIDYYERAAIAPQPTPFADIYAKASFGLGQAYLIQSYADPEVMVAPAIGKFNEVIGLYGDGQNPQLEELAAESHWRLALIYRTGNDTDSAMMHYEKAIDLLDRIGSIERRDKAIEQLERLQ